jgi:hypothetical protein
LQRAQLLDNEEPENDAGPDRAEKVLQAMPEAYAAQRSEVTPLSGREPAGVILSVLCEGSRWNVDENCF